MLLLTHKGGEEMNNIFEKVNYLCVKKHISVTKLEKSVGFGCGTIFGWRKGSPTVANLQKVADYFGISITKFLNKRGEK